MNFKEFYTWILKNFVQCIFYSNICCVIIFYFYSTNSYDKDNSNLYVYKFSYFIKIITLFKVIIVIQI